MIGGELILANSLRDLYCHPSAELVQRLDNLQDAIDNHEYGVLYVPSMYYSFVSENFLNSDHLSDEKIKELLNLESHTRHRSIKREVLHEKQKRRVASIVEHISQLDENLGLNMARIPNAFFTVGELILYAQRIFSSHEKCKKEDLDKCEEALFGMSTQIPRVARINELIQYRYNTHLQINEEADLDFLLEVARFIKEG